ATDTAGNTDPTPAAFTWTVDTVAPQTAFTATPPDPSNGPASFTISTDADATLQCSLDNAAFAACSSPVSIPLTGLPDGSHSFRARGVDGAGNIDATPAAFTWTTDTIAPTITLGSAPATIASSTTATFNWTTNESAAYSCRVDAAAFVACGSGTVGTKTFSGLTQGNHTFNVRATDGAGNVSATTAFSWTVDTVAPETTFTATPANPSNGQASFTIATHAHAPPRERLLAAASVAACSSPVATPPTTRPAGSHPSLARGIAGAANTDSAPASFTWTVDTVAPNTTIDPASKPTDPTASTSAS